VLSRFQLLILFQTLFSLLISPITSYSPILELGFKRPHARKLELEADYIGLHLVARACYDPEVATTVWRNMQQVDRQAPPEFFSTHPSHANRIERIQEWMPALRRVREEADCSTLRTHLGVFRRWT
jgi:Zn-dependent protease with chaperone function